MVGVRLRIERRAGGSSIGLKKVWVVSREEVSGSWKSGKERDRGD